MNPTTTLTLLLASVLCCLASLTANAQFLRPQDVVKLPSSPADHRIQYGSDPLQFGDLRLPKIAGPHPVAIVIHGGCWLTRFADVQGTAAMSDALTKAGVATWNIEYRRVDSAGGGWPGTFLDIANAVDHLRQIAKPHRLDLQRVMVVGHSAGGHFALWAAARHRLPKTSPLFIANPLRVQAVVNLAGPGNLKSMLPLQQRVCGDVPITKLVGGTPEEVADHYREASPAELLPLKVEQVLITGAKDGAVPPALGKEYEEAARRKGDKVRMIVVENAAHFEVIAPGTPAWKIVEEAVLATLKIRAANNVTLPGAAFAQAEKSDAELQRVQQAAEKFVDAFVNLDWERFRACWAADATIFHPFAELPRRLSGREEIVASFKNRFEDLKKQKPRPPYLNIQPKDLEVKLLGSTALVTFHLGGETSQGRRTLVLQKQGGDWLIVHLHASNLTLPTGEKK